MNRQQHRQAKRKVESESRILPALAKAFLIAEQYTKGYNRKARRDAYRATRRRTDGRRKQFPKVAS
jgi:hypothetical protein